MGYAMINSIVTEKDTTPAKRVSAPPLIETPTASDSGEHERYMFDVVLSPAVREQFAKYMQTGWKLT